MILSKKKKKTGETPRKCHYTDTFDRRQDIFIRHALYTTDLFIKTKSTHLFYFRVDYQPRVSREYTTVDFITNLSLLSEDQIEHALFS